MTLVYCTMGYRIVVLLALFCQVKSQLCVTPGVPPQVIANAQMITAPQVITTPIVATTIIDNSVSTALANALQLLIVSDIIESKLGANGLSNLLNLCPIDTCAPRIEVIQPIADYVTPISPCAPIEFISPLRPILEPYPCGCPDINTNFGFVPNCNPCGCEILSPCLPNVYLPDATPNRNCYNVAEFLSPNFNPYGCAPVCGTDIITLPPCNNGCFGGYNELVTTFPCGEIITPCNPCGIPEVISPCGPCYGIPEVITPIPCNCGCYGNIPECITPYNPFNVGCGIPDVVRPCTPCYGGFPEVIPPIYKPGCSGIPELIPANPFGPCCEIITPCPSFPDVIVPSPCNTGCPGCEFCGPPAFTPCGLNDFVNPVGPFAPIAAEVLIPPCIPAQLNCNFGYSPSIGPCVNFNVEPLPFGPGFC